MNIPISILDLAMITEESDPSQALAHTLDLAQHAEKWGYERFWLAEHHNMPGIASAATAVVIGYVAGGTERIKVGAGGIMLPNHAPLVVAEQFGTLEALYPGRIELGLGRAPGTDQRTAHALRRDLASNADLFPHDLEELQVYLGENEGPVQAIPGTGSHVPIWLLGSSLFSAQLAAAKGLPYAFASHFAPGALDRALELYRTKFRPSEVLERPRVMVAVNVYAADTDEEAELQFSSLVQLFVSLRFGRPGRLAPPRPDLAQHIPPQYIEAASSSLSYSAVGSPTTVKEKLEAIIEHTQADDLILVSHIYDHKARLRCFEIVAELMACQKSG